MDLVDLANSLGKDIPDDALETIADMITKAQVLSYCRRFPMATKKAAPKAAPKESPKAAPKEAPKVVTRRQEG